MEDRFRCLPSSSRELVRCGSASRFVAPPLQRERRFRDHFRLAELVGEGKFGCVYRCIEQCTGRQLAAKRVTAPQPREKQDFEREVAILSKMRHPNIVRFHDAFGLCEKMVLVTEMQASSARRRPPTERFSVEGGELFDRIADDAYEFSEEAAADITRQICEAVKYIHKQNIVHLDIKPENILCVSRHSNDVKLIDFGLAQQVETGRELTVMAGTPEYVAPEVISFDAISFKTDMWSVGVIAYILSVPSPSLLRTRRFSLSGISPFLGDNDAETYGNVTRGIWDFDCPPFDKVSRYAKDFVAELLKYKSK